MGSSSKLQIGFVSVAVSNAATFSAADGGYFQKYGLDVDLVSIATSPQGIAAIISGEVPVNTGISGTQIVAANLKGEDTLLLASSVNTFPFSVMVQPEITSFDALRGKRIGLSQFGSATDTAVRVYLNHVHLDPSADVSLVQTGGLPQTLAALQAKSIDAGLLTPPVTQQAASLGFSLLADLGQLGFQYCTNGIGTTRSYYQNNQDLMQNLTKAIVEGVHRFKTDQSFGEAVIQHWTQVDDPAVLTASWQPFATEYLQDHLYVTDGAIQTVLGEIAETDPSAQSAAPSQFYDNTILNNLETSGFFASIGIPSSTS